MHGLRLSRLDPAAAGALRVISYFDRLVENHSDPDALTRATALLAECAAGTADHRRAADHRYGPDARALPPGEAAPTSSRAVVVDGRTVGEVWLERTGGAWPHDGLVLERLALATALAFERAGSLSPSAHPPQWGDPALVQAALTTRGPEAERSRALHLLGLRPDEPLRAVAVVAPDAVLMRRALCSCARALSAAHPRLGRPAPFGALWSTVGAILLPGPADAGPGGPALPEGVTAGLPDGVAVGTGPSGTAARLPDSWAQARRAARFAGLGPTWPNAVDATELGTLALLADIPGDAALAHPDTAALAGLGSEDLATLDAVCRTPSVRAAAQLLHLHHSSVAQRVARIERSLGFGISGPHGRQRVQTALLLRQLNAPAASSLGPQPF
ncbi:helix-turn-helix domain-containing protein [Streptomyces sp. NPDC020667]|uniref:helix-turn-helix domain-containing protein n=1 Tax=Streptomyces sp. NPDC020667 TaxID=3154895 RepID=UPI003400A47D